MTEFESQTVELLCSPFGYLMRQIRTLNPVVPSYHSPPSRLFETCCHSYNFKGFWNAYLWVGNNL